VLKGKMNTVLDDDALVNNDLGMNVTHHILLQVLWAKQSLTLVEVEQVFKRIIEKYEVPNNPALKDYIQTINSALLPLGFGVKNEKINNIVVCSIVNLKKDEIMKQHCPLDKDVLKVYSTLCNVLDAKEASELMRVGINGLWEAVKEQNDVKKESFYASLKTLVEQGFVADDENGYYSIGDRARLELRDMTKMYK
jgi:hypothetical protein